jgi:hypothetical protein
MKPLGPFFRILWVFVVADILVPVGTKAQLYQQTPKLIGTGAVGLSGQGSSVSLSTAATLR